MTKGRYSIKEAAGVLGLSEKQVRSRVKKGELEAEKEPAPGGFRYLVLLEGEGEGQAGVTQGIPDLEGLIKAATGPLEREIRSLKRLVKEERRKVEQLSAQYGRAVVR